MSQATEIMFKARYYALQQRILNIYSEEQASSWDLFAHFGIQLTLMLEAWSLEFINWHHLPWTNILPMEIMGEVLHATETALSSTRLRLGAYAQPGAPLPTQQPLTLRVKVVFLPFFVKIVNENEFSCKSLNRYFTFKRILSLKLKRN